MRRAGTRQNGDIPGVAHFLLIMKHTPPPLIFPASAVLSIRKQKTVIRRSYSGVRDEGVSHVSDNKDVTVPNVPLETCPGSKVVHLIFQGLDICEQNTGERGAVSFVSQSVTDSSTSSAVVFRLLGLFEVPLLTSAFRRISAGHAGSVDKVSRSRFSAAVSMSKSVLLS